MASFTAPDYNPQDPAAFLYTLSDAYLAFIEA